MSLNWEMEPSLVTLCADPRSELRKRRFASTSGEAVESAATEVAEGENMGGLIGNDYCNGWRCC